MKKLFLALATVISTFAIASNAAAATVTVDLSRYSSETLSETFAAENIDYDFANSNYNDANDVVTIYVFRKDGCINCKNFYNFIKSSLLPAYSDKFRVVSYELSQNPTNFTLLNAVADAYGQKPADGVYGTPVVIVGNTMSTSAVNGTRQQEIINLVTSGTTTDDITDSSNIKANMKNTFSDSNITLTTTAKYYPNHTLSAIATDASSIKLDGYEYISAHDIQLMNNAVTVPLTNTSLTLSIPINKTYQSYKVAYVQNGQIAEVIDAQYQNGFVTFNTSHLSEYVVYGSNTQSSTTEDATTNITTVNKLPKSPNTAAIIDAAIECVIPTFILITALAATIITVRQKRNS